LGLRQAVHIPARNGLWNVQQGSTGAAGLG